MSGQHPNFYCNPSLPTWGFSPSIVWHENGLLSTFGFRSTPENHTVAWLKWFLGRVFQDFCGENHQDHFPSHFRVTQKNHFYPWAEFVCVRRTMEDFVQVRILRFSRKKCSTNQCHFRHGIYIFLESDEEKENYGSWMNKERRSVDSG